jgi:hypothetical protein
LEIQPLVFKLELRHLLRALAKIEKEAHEAALHASVITTSTITPSLAPSMSGLSSAPKHTGQARTVALPPIIRADIVATISLSADANLSDECARPFI